MNNNYETAIIHWTLKLSGLGGGVVAGQQGQFWIRSGGFGSAGSGPGRQERFWVSRGGEPWS